MTTTKQRLADDAGVVLRVDDREFYRAAGFTWWSEQPSGRQVDDETQERLDELERTAPELAPEELKPVDVDELYDDLVDALVAADLALEEELGRTPTAADRDVLSESELALQVLGRDDTAAVAAVAEALDRTYANQNVPLRSIFAGTQECC